MNKVEWHLLSSVGECGYFQIVQLIETESGQIASLDISLSGSLCQLLA